MGYTYRLTWENLRSVDATLLNGLYQELETPLQHPSYICKIVNTSDELVTISIDGVNDIDVVPANSFWLYDESKVGAHGAFPALPAGTQFYVNGHPATDGDIYLVTQYIIVN